MCGIVAGIVRTNIVPLILNGLDRLEYRGYDSAGLAVRSSGFIEVVKTVGKVEYLRNSVEKAGSQGLIGIGHTRWATHGSPTEVNAHPHATEAVALVHNGIIENYIELKSELESLGYCFKSATDTEVIVNLLDFYLQNSTPEEAMRKTVARLTGAYSIVCMFRDFELLCAVTNKTPLVLGLGDGGTFIASDAIAFDKGVEKVIYLEEGDSAILRAESYEIFDKNYSAVERKTQRSFAAGEVSKNGFPHFMLKEIHEQPAVIEKCAKQYLNLENPDRIGEMLKGTRSIKIVACGTAYYSGFVAKYILEETAGIPVDLEIASEYRYRKTAKKENEVTIVVSQSGETIDTLEALRRAKAEGHKVIAVVNTENSSIGRAADYVLPIMAGPEVGVASTKAFLGQVTTFTALAMRIGLANSYLSAQRFEILKNSLLKAGKLIEGMLLEPAAINEAANYIKNSGGVLFIGRGNLYPIALEGALKLKELSYVHTGGYAAGELKHGPIALIDSSMPVVTLVPSDFLFEKVFSNMQEIVARKGNIISIVSSSCVKKVESISAKVIEVPDCDEILAPIIYSLPIQLLAYRTAVLKGLDVDRPRNLAKSVTVE